MEELRLSQIQKLGPCVGCGKGVNHSNQILSTRVRVTRFMTDPNAVQRATGLAMMIGAPLAAVMGPDEGLMKALEEEKAVLICDACAMTKTIAELWGV